MSIYVNPKSEFIPEKRLSLGLCLQLFSDDSVLNRPTWVPRGFWLLSSVVLSKCIVDSAWRAEGLWVGLIRFFVAQCELFSEQLLQASARGGAVMVGSPRFCFSPFLPTFPPPNFSIWVDLIHRLFGCFSLIVPKKVWTAQLNAQKVFVTIATGRQLTGTQLAVDKAGSWQTCKALMFYDFWII